MRDLRHSPDHTLRISREGTKFKNISYNSVKKCSIITLEYPNCAPLVKSIVASITTEYQGTVTEFRAWEESEEPDTEMILARVMCDIELTPGVPKSDQVIHTSSMSS